MNFILMNKELEEKLGCKDILKINSEQLMGRFDINLSLKVLGKSPYEKINEIEYEKLKKEYSIKDVVSLFSEEISETRKCMDIGVSDNFCICDDHEITSIKNEVMPEDMKSRIKKTINIKI